MLSSLPPSRSNEHGCSPAGLSRFRQNINFALYAYARSLVKVDALFYSKAAEAGLFREDVRDPKRAFCGGGGE